MIYWAPLLHFYQPPTQTHGVLEKIVNESYRPLVQLFREYPQAKVTVNINGVLTEMLTRYCFGDVIDGLRELAERGQIEFTGSGMYHPILPLIPAGEQRRQILLNRKANESIFGPAYQPNGFFPPEMAFSPEILPPIISAGHKWVILSGVACPTSWPLDVVHRSQVEGEDIAIFFRDDVLSNKISFKNISGGEFLEHLRSIGAEPQRGNSYVVTAMDAETFGHHIKNWERLFLAEVYEVLGLDKEPLSAIRQQADLVDQHRSILDLAEKTNNISVVTISELLGLFPQGDIINPYPSSWSTTGDDIKAGNYYPLWDDPGNAVHSLLWQHLDMVIQLERMASAMADTEESRRFAEVARALLDRALHSDQWWWASMRPMWEINLIDKGMVEQKGVILNAFKSVLLSGAPKAVKKDMHYKMIVARELGEDLRDYLFFGSSPHPW